MTYIGRSIEKSSTMSNSSRSRRSSRRSAHVARMPVSRLAITRGVKRRLITLRCQVCRGGSIRIISFWPTSNFSSDTPSALENRSGATSAFQQSSKRVSA